MGGLNFAHGFPHFKLESSLERVYKDWQIPKITKKQDRHGGLSLL